VAATRLAIDLDHPAYDCLYLALAIARDCPFVTADERFLRKLGQARQRTLRGKAISLTEAAQP
jgi:predicted nucleic acid-binding protein